VGTHTVPRGRATAITLRRYIYEPTD
jgi:hypothetical protein